MYVTPLPATAAYMRPYIPCTREHSSNVCIAALHGSLRISSWLGRGTFSPSNALVHCSLASHMELRLYPPIKQKSSYVLRKTEIPQTIWAR